MDGFAIAALIICTLLACCGGCFFALNKHFFGDVLGRGSSVSDGRSAPAASYGAADSTHGS